MGRAQFESHAAFKLWMVMSNEIFQAFQCNSIKYVYVYCYTANILDAETATISCVTRPVALQMHYVKLLAAANF